MKVFCKLVLTFILVSYCSQAVSRSKLDSLIALYKSTKNDTLKIRLAVKISRKTEIANPADTSDLKYLKEAYSNAQIAKYPALKCSVCKALGNLYYRANLFDLALRFDKEALKTAFTLKDERSIIDIYFRTAIVYGAQRKHEAAEQELIKGIALAKKRNDTIQLARFYNGLAGQYQETGETENAIKYFYKSMEMYDVLNDTTQVISLLRNTSLAYQTVKDFARAKQLLYKALDISVQYKDSSMLSGTYGAIGAMYQNTLQFDSALIFNTQQIDYLNKAKDGDDLAIAYGNLGIIYKAKKDYANSKVSYLKALEIFKRLNSYRLVTISYINLGELFVLMKQPEQALIYYDDAIKQTDLSEKEILAAAHQGKYEAFLSMKNYKGALQEFVTYKSLDDSLRQEKSLTKILRMESQYEIGKKQKENELLKAQNEIKQTLISVSKKNEKTTKLFLYGSLAVLAVIMVLAVLLLINLKQNKLKTQIINEQKNLVEEKNKDITDSINYAKLIQDALLPAKEVKYSLFSNAFVLFKPRDIVSGDFYWFMQKNGKRIIAAVDCTGHGVPGAFMSLIGNTFLTEVVEGKNITEPALILSELRHMIIKSLKQTGDPQESKDGMDMALLTFDDDTNTVEYAGANNPLWLMRNGECIEYKADKRPIGYYQGKGLPFTNHKIELVKGDTLYIFTDGFADQFGGNSGKKFKYKPFKELLLSIQNKPMLTQEEILLQNFDAWKGHLDQIDDVLIIGVRV